MNLLTAPVRDFTPLVQTHVFAEKYLLLEPIGSGGMGVIYKAKQLILDKIVAIKMLHPQIASTTSLRRFQQEGRAAGSLSHPNIIAIHDFGLTENDNAYMVMDFCEGSTLAQIIKAHGPLELDRFCDIFLQVCNALSHAHKNGVLHRDIKPSNIMLTNDQYGNTTVKILDFGIAKLLENCELSSDSELTRTGEAVGSPMYMSPEQCLGRRVDCRTDLYSLGCVMYEALTGLAPFEGKSALETVMKQLNEDPLPLKEVTLGKQFPSVLESLVLKLLAKNPDNRYGSMDAVATDLESLKASLDVSTAYDALPAQESVKPRQKLVTPALTLVAFIVLILALSASRTKEPDLAAVAQTSPAEQKQDSREDWLAARTAIVCMRDSDESLKDLAGYKNLQFLDLSKSDIDGSGFRYISALPLTQLRVRHTRLRDRSLALLATFDRMTALDISESPEITDKGLMYLLPMESLKVLKIDYCRNLTLKRVAQLQQVLPNLVVNPDCDNVYGVAFQKADRERAARKFEKAAHSFMELADMLAQNRGPNAQLMLRRCKVELAYCESDLGRPALCESYYRQAMAGFDLRSARQFPYSNDQVSCLWAAGAYYSARGMLKKGEAYYREALAISEEHPTDRDQLKESLNALSANLVQQHRLDEAQALDRRQLDCSLQAMSVR